MVADLSSLRLLVQQQVEIVFVVAATPFSGGLLR